jgi:heme/copper-type cytochrome/quinol oxidase subunit 2
MLVIILGLLAWGGWIVTGVVLGEYSRQDTAPSDKIALYKGLLVAVSVVLFVIFWSLALLFRSRRLSRQQDLADAEFDSGKNASQGR